MARSPSSPARAARLRREIRRLIDKLEPGVSEAFSSSVKGINSEVVLTQVIEALANRDIEGAVSALNIDEAGFSALHDALSRAYREGGKTTAAQIPNLENKNGTADVVVRFNVANPGAERQISELAGTRVAQVTEDTRLAARSVILKGYEQGQGPISIGLDLAGRVGSSGRREGGVIGMSPPQAAAASALRERMLSGNPAEMAKVLDMKLRDKRFDPAIRRHIEAGTKPTKADVDRMYVRYVDNAIKLRGETIARTETGRAVHAAAHEAFRQGLEKAGYTSANVVRVWRSAGDSRVRDSHAEMNGQKVIGLNTPFIAPSGAQLLHPLDPTLGAGPEEIINCRCDEELNIDYSAGLLPDRLL